jgi:DNA ligase-1
VVAKKRANKRRKPIETFSRLLDSLVFSSSRNEKLRLIQNYLRMTPDPARGYALAALTGDLKIPAAKSATIRSLVEKRMDAELFAMSYDYVGDMAETVALIWTDVNYSPPKFTEVVEELQKSNKASAAIALEKWMDRLDTTGRWALLKLATGGLRVGVSARLAKMALAQEFEASVDEVEEIWHSIEPPYDDLFRWLEGSGEKPNYALGAGFRPVMLANPLEEGLLSQLDPLSYVAEWKWDGIRVQAISRGGERKLYTRTGEDIGNSFPDILNSLEFDGVIDGELLIRSQKSHKSHEPAPFSVLQKRLGRKRPSTKIISEMPAFIRAYDLLFEGEEDLRGVAFEDRRKRLEIWAKNAPSTIDISATIPFKTWQELSKIRSEARETGIEGLMLKRKTSFYLSGRPKNQWYKWKREPLTVDLVLMYAQRGHGRRSSYYSDFTLGAWSDAETLVPVCKAYSGYTDKELIKIDKWVREHTNDRFGPVRSVTPGLVLEIAFDAAQYSKRHKSGVALRFPRIKRLRWDKPISEAETLKHVKSLIQEPEF